MERILHIIPEWPKNAKIKKEQEKKTGPYQTTNNDYWRMDNDEKTKPWYIIKEDKIYPTRINPYVDYFRTGIRRVS